LRKKVRGNRELGPCNSIGNPPKGKYPSKGRGDWGLKAAVGDLMESAGRASRNLKGGTEFTAVKGVDSIWASGIH